MEYSLFSFLLYTSQVLSESPQRPSEGKALEGSKCLTSLHNQQTGGWISIGPPPCLVQREQAGGRALGSLLPLPPSNVHGPSPPANVCDSIFSSPANVCITCNMLKKRESMFNFQTIPTTTY